LKNKDSKSAQKPWKLLVNNNHFIIFFSSHCESQRQTLAIRFYAPMCPLRGCMLQQIIMDLPPQAYLGLELLSPVTQIKHEIVKWKYKHVFLYIIYILTHKYFLLLFIVILKGILICFTNCTPKKKNCFTNNFVTCYYYPPPAVILPTTSHHAVSSI
jgi:hypothetical protein